MGTKCLLMALLLLSLAMAVEICPADKMPTTITISHQRSPANIALGITDNTIVISTVLTFTNTETGQKAPLAGKEILMEITLLDKFLARTPDGTYFLSSIDPRPPLNFTTTADGSIGMTLYTNRLFGQITNPKKISYSIKATYTPNSTREMFLGSYKSVNYVPGSFPIVSFATCMPLLIVFALLAGALFAAGRSPLSFFDFSRVAFNAPTMKRRQVKGMTFSNPLVNALFKAGATVAMKGAFTGLSKGAALVGKGITSGANSLSKWTMSQGKKVGENIEKKRALATGAAPKTAGSSAALVAVGKTVGVVGKTVGWLFGAVGTVAGVAGGRVGKTKKSAEEMSDASNKVKKLGVSKEEADKLAKGGFLRKGIEMEALTTPKIDAKGNIVTDAKGKVVEVPIAGRYVVVHKADLVTATKRLRSFNEVVLTEGVGPGFKGALAWAGQVFAQSWKQGLAGGMTGGFTIWSYAKQNIPIIAYSRIGKKSDADKAKEIKGIVDDLNLSTENKEKYVKETKGKDGKTVLTLTAAGFALYQGTDLRSDAKLDITVKDGKTGKDTIVPIDIVDMSSPIFYIRYAAAGISLAGSKMLEKRKWAMAADLQAMGINPSMLNDVLKGADSKTILDKINSISDEGNRALARDYVVGLSGKAVTPHFKDGTAMRAYLADNNVKPQSIVDIETIIAKYEKLEKTVSNDKEKLSELKSGGIPLDETARDKWKTKIDGLETRIGKEESDLSNQKAVVSAARVDIAQLDLASDLYKAGSNAQAAAAMSAKDTLGNDLPDNDRAKQLAGALESMGVDKGTREIYVKQQEDGTYALNADRGKIDQFVASMATVNQCDPILAEYKTAAVQIAIAVHYLGEDQKKLDETIQDNVQKLEAAGIKVPVASSADGVHTCAELAGIITNTEGTSKSLMAEKSALETARAGTTKGSLEWDKKSEEIERLGSTISQLDKIADSMQKTVDAYKESVEKNPYLTYATTNDVNETNTQIRSIAGNELSAHVNSASLDEKEKTHAIKEINEANKSLNEAMANHDLNDEQKAYERLEFDKKLESIKDDIPFRDDKERIKASEIVAGIGDKLTDQIRDEVNFSNHPSQESLNKIYTDHGEATSGSIAATAGMLASNVDSLSAQLSSQLNVSNTEGAKRWENDWFGVQPTVAGTVTAPKEEEKEAVVKVPLKEEQKEAVIEVPLKKLVEQPRAPVVGAQRESTPEVKQPEVKFEFEPYGKSEYEVKVSKETFKGTQEREKKETGEPSMKENIKTIWEWAKEKVKKKEE